MVLQGNYGAEQQHEKIRNERTIRCGKKKSRSLLLSRSDGVLLDGRNVAGGEGEGEGRESGLQSLPCLYESIKWLILLPGPFQHFQSLSISDGTKGTRMPGKAFNPGERERERDTGSEPGVINPPDPNPGSSKRAASRLPERIEPRLVSYIVWDGTRGS